MRWPWSRPEIRSSSYADVIQSSLFDAALGSPGKPQPQETSTVLACCRLWSAAASSFTVEPAGGLLLDELASVGWRLGRYGWYGARLEGGQFETVDQFRRLPSGWYSVEIDRDGRTVRALIPPTDFLLIQLPGGRAPWRSSGAEALAALDRALAVDARKPIGLALGSGLEGALDLAAVTQTLTSAWKTDFKEGSVIVSDGKPTAAHTGPSPHCSPARPISGLILLARSSIPTGCLEICFWARELAAATRCGSSLRLQDRGLHR